MDGSEKVVPIKPPEEEVLSNANDILGSNDFEYATIDAWGKKVRIQSLTAGDILEWSEAGEGEAKKTAGLRLIIKSVVDGTGKLVFSPNHISILRTKNHKQTEKVIEAIIKLNGLTIRGAELKKD